MNRIHIVGRKNSGKTGLIVELVEYLSRQGYRIGTIKHTHHHHELDTPGKDSHRHREAGAAVVGILSPGMAAAFRPLPDRSGEPSRYVMLAPMFADCDLVLVEGDLQARAPKVEVWRAATSNPPIAEEDTSIAAVVSDDPAAVRVPIWKRSEMAAVAEGVLQATKLQRPSQAPLAPQQLALECGQRGDMRARRIWLRLPAHPAVGCG